MAGADIRCRAGLRGLHRRRRRADRDVGDGFLGMMSMLNAGRLNIGGRASG